MQFLGYIILFQVFDCCFLGFSVSLNLRQYTPCADILVQQCSFSKVLVGELKWFRLWVLSHLVIGMVAFLIAKCIWKGD